MATTSDDQALLESIQREEPEAFERFVDRYGDRIYGFGMRVCGEREDARDVAQDTLFQAFRSLKQLKEPRAIRSWLYRVAANACLMKRRRSKFEPQRELSLEELMPRFDGATAAEVADVGPLPDELLSREEARSAVRAAIAALPAPYRVVLALRDIEELSTRETAEALEVPESTIKMRLHRARLMVRKRLEELGRERAGEETS